MAKTVHKMYGGAVELTFDPDARYRYHVTDKENGLISQPIPGTTTVLGNVFDKPGLRSYPLNMAMQYLFGAKWDDFQLKYVADHEYIKKNLVDFADPQIAQEWLDQCYAVAKDKAQAGRDTGTEAHRLIAEYLQSYIDGGRLIKGSPDDDPTATKMEAAFGRWYKTQNIKPLKVEQPVYSRSKRFAGTYDSILEIDGKITLCDIKTTNVSRYALKKGKDWTGIYPENFLQLGAYSLAFKEEQEAQFESAFEQATQERLGRVTKIQNLMVINVTKDGKVHTISSSELGISVEEWEKTASNMMDAHDILARTRKVKPVEVSEVAA